MGASDDAPNVVKPQMPNITGSKSIFLCKDTAPIVLVNTVLYTAYYCLQPSLSSLFIKLFGYTKVKAGLIYIPFGVGCFVASLLSCKLVHSRPFNQVFPVIGTKGVWHQAKIFTNDYHYTATRQGFPTSSSDTSQSQKLAYPISHTYLRSMIYLLPLSTLPMIAYGWVLEYHLHRSLSFILQFFIGGSITIIFNACGFPLSTSILRTLLQLRLP